MGGAQEQVGAFVGAVVGRLASIADERGRSVHQDARLPLACVHILGRGELAAFGLAGPLPSTAAGVALLANLASVVR
ncbi:hypothetical protein SAMN05216215_101896 [Saccharopolyspora shandongensis]|uniref:Uncharacterized protein n=1 Tax=Saccharopolyspora shandongensis TaxID=418495 RepID=A0A1H3GC75_9PSEU|nr:hypothetical protein SAMN05216215_101896 [Saccharopolyspora shandongensis]